MIPETAADRSVSRLILPLTLQNAHCAPSSYGL